MSEWLHHEGRRRVLSSFHLTEVGLFRRFLELKSSELKRQRLQQIQPRASRIKSARLKLVQIDAALQLAHRLIDTPVLTCRKWVCMIECAILSV